MANESLPVVIINLLYSLLPLNILGPKDQLAPYLELLIFSFIVLAILKVDLDILIVCMERKFIARMMIRRGPTHIGPAGLMQNIADALKFLSKEIVFPEKSDKFGLLVALFIMIVTAAVSVMALPWSSNFIVFAPSAGVLFVFAIFSMYPIGVLVAGWASNNKYSLLGGFRSAAQLISYEIPMVLSVLGVIMLVNWNISNPNNRSFSFLNIVQFQQLHTWLVFLIPVGFIVYFVSMLAETERIPFLLPEAESELVMRWRTEFGSGPYMLIMAIEYFHAFVNSALAVLLFLGGWSMPTLFGIDFSTILDPAVWFLIKVHIIIFAMILLRAALPRVRIDQFLNIGWRYLIPFSFINLAMAISIGVAAPSLIA